MCLSAVLIITVRANPFSAKIWPPRYWRTENNFRTKREKTMNTFKSLVAAAVLTFALAFSAAGQAPVCNPGETQTPPCPSALTSDDTDDPAVLPGETQNPPEAQSVGIVSLVELALHALLLA